MGNQEALDFEQLVIKLLLANGFSRAHMSDFPQHEVDLVADARGQRWVVEIKFYRTARAQVQLIRTAAAGVANYRRKVQARRAMLVVSSVLPFEIKSTLEKELGISIAGRDELFAWCAKVPELADQLAALLEIESTDYERPAGRSVEGILGTEPGLPVAPLPPPETTGASLCQRLRQLERGRPKWAAYERLCEEVLRYLFTNDVHGWHRQRRTDDGLNRFDLICRIKPTTEFWRFLIQHLGTRYVLFEFKNYAKSIKQGQILTTEKYLLEKGLRRASIMFTRAGAGADAISMKTGAMREHGKLILVLDDDQVCEMLHMRDRGEDPSDLLFGVADDFLLSLSR